MHACVFDSKRYETLCSSRVLIMRRRCRTTQFLMLCWYCQDAAVNVITLCYYVYQCLLCLSWTIAACIRDGAGVFAKPTKQAQGSAVREALGLTACGPRMQQRQNVGWLSGNPHQACS